MATRKPSFWRNLPARRHQGASARRTYRHRQQHVSASNAHHISPCAWLFSSAGDRGSLSRPNRRAALTSAGQSARPEFIWPGLFRMYSNRQALSHISPPPPPLCGYPPPPTHPGHAASPTLVMTSSTQRPTWRLRTIRRYAEGASSSMRTASKGCLPARRSGGSRRSRRAG